MPDRGEPIALKDILDGDEVDLGFFGNFGSQNEELTQSLLGYLTRVRQPHGNMQLRTRRLQGDYLNFQYIPSEFNDLTETTYEDDDIKGKLGTIEFELVRPRRLGFELFFTDYGSDRPIVGNSFDLGGLGRGTEFACRWLQRHTIPTRKQEVVFRRGGTTVRDGKEVSIADQIHLRAAGNDFGDPPIMELVGPVWFQQRNRAEFIITGVFPCYITKMEVIPTMYDRTQSHVRIRATIKIELTEAVEAPDPS